MSCCPAQHTTDGGTYNITPSQWRNLFEEYKETRNLGVVEGQCVHSQQQLFTELDQCPHVWQETQAGPLENHSLWVMELEELMFRMSVTTLSEQEYRETGNRVGVDSWLSV